MFLLLFNTTKCPHLILEHGRVYRLFEPVHLLNIHDPFGGYFMHLCLHIPLPLTVHPITAHAFCSLPLCSSFAKATVTMVVRGLKDKQAGEHGGLPPPSLRCSHLDERYTLGWSFPSPYSAPMFLMCVL